MRGKNGKIATENVPVSFEALRTPAVIHSELKELRNNRLLPLGQAGRLQRQLLGYLQRIRHVLQFFWGLHWLLDGFGVKMRKQWESK